MPAGTHHNLLQLLLDHSIKLVRSGIRGIQATVHSSRQHFPSIANPIMLLSDDKVKYSVQPGKVDPTVIPELWNQAASHR